MQWSTDARRMKAAIWCQALRGDTSVSCPIGQVVGIRRRKGQLLAFIRGWGRWYPVEELNELLTLEEEELGPLPRVGQAFMKHVFRLRKRP